MTLATGFPAATLDTTASSVSVPTGASAFLNVNTPVGARYGSSVNKPYINLGAKGAAPSVTTYTFASGTPSGGWSFVLGDVDADAVTISATKPDGSAVSAAELGFEGVTQNSIDAVSHRDWTLEFLSACAILGTTLSRYAEDFVTWSATEFGYVTFSDAYTTGSSMMPNKKNPDGFELARGKCGRLVGNLTALMTTVKGAPLTYSRDLQEDKEPVFDSAETVSVLLGIFDGALRDAKWHADRMECRLTDLLLATDLADYLVEDGVPFRDAHHLVGALVGEATRSGKGLLELPAAHWTELPGGLAIRGKLSFASSLARRNIEGGTGPVSVANQLEIAAALLEQASVAQAALDQGGF
jgi:argininosuccinate lyase